MLFASFAELARTFVAVLACMGAVPVLLLVTALMVKVWPEREPRYRGRRRAGGRVWLPW